MEIVIKIPRKIYEHIRAEGGHGIFNPWMGDDNEIVTKAIFNGTPLSEHHGRLIDADALKNKIMYKDDVAYETWDELYDSVLEEIDNAPTIIEGSDSE